jgi:hypothetical protein
MAMFRSRESVRLMLALAVVWGASPAAEQPAAPPTGERAEAAPAAAEAAPAHADAAAAKPEEAHARARARRPVHRSPEAVLDERVAALGRALNLDAGQKVEVRRILVAQREQLRQVWNDPARASADRIGASQAINQRTEDRIRSILNEQQRQQYIVSKPAGATGERPEHGLDYWMDQMQGNR